MRSCRSPRWGRAGLIGACEVGEKIQGSRKYTGCKQVSYCGRACQKDWKRHKTCCGKSVYGGSTSCRCWAIATQGLLGNLLFTTGQVSSSALRKHNEVVQKKGRSKRDGARHGFERIERPLQLRYLPFELTTLPPPHHHHRTSQPGIQLNQ